VQLSNVDGKTYLPKKNILKITINLVDDGLII